MAIKTAPASPLRVLDNEDDFAEVRLEAIGYVFHGNLPKDEGKRRPAIKAGSNLLHFARCAKLEKVPVVESKIWFRSIGAAKVHLDTSVGLGRWKWCKLCEREITQRILDEQ